MHDDPTSVSRTVLDDIRLFRYMERMHLTYEQAMNEPIEVINRAFIIWHMDKQAQELNRPKSD